MMKCLVISVVVILVAGVAVAMPPEDRASNTLDVDHDALYNDEARAIDVDHDALYDDEARALDVDHDALYDDEARAIMDLKNPNNRNQQWTNYDVPKNACVKIKVIYNNNWVNSAGEGDNAKAYNRANEVIREAERILQHKYRNSLMTSFKLNIAAVIHDDRQDWRCPNCNNWQATGQDLLHPRLNYHTVRNWILDTSIDHYAFLADDDGRNAFGFAQMSSALGNDQARKVSITEWHKNSVLATAGVFAHEFAHALGINHDFKQLPNNLPQNYRYANNGQVCSNIHAQMDYMDMLKMTQWSRCSNEDWYHYYQWAANNLPVFRLSC